MAEGLPGGFEAELAEWRAIVARDADAFSRWFARCEIRLRLSLVSFAASIDVEGVVQRAAMLTWERAAIVRPDGRRAIEPDGEEDFLYRWAVTVARNDARTQQKRANREDSLDGPAQNEGRESRRRAIRIAEHAENARRPDPMLRERVQQCIERLSTSLRSVILGRVHDRGRHSDKALAVLLAIPYDRYRKFLQRGRDALTRCLATHGINVSEYL